MRTLQTCIFISSRANATYITCKLDYDYHVNHLTSIKIVNWRNGGTRWRLSNQLRTVVICDLIPDYFTYFLPTLRPPIFLVRIAHYTYSHCTIQCSYERGRLCNYYSDNYVHFVYWWQQWTKKKSCKRNQ